MSRAAPPERSSRARQPGAATPATAPPGAQGGADKGAWREQLAGLSAAQRAALARRIAARRSAERDPPGAPAGPLPAPDGAPPSFAQERMWILERSEPHTALYNRPASLRLRGPLDVAALERGLNEVVRRHAVLRTRLQDRGGRLIQVTEAFEPFALAVVELASTGEAAGSEARLRAMAEREARRRFDLEGDRPWRALLVRLDPLDHALLLTFHHAAFDGWSFAILCDELATAYRAFHAGHPVRLPDLALQYPEYAARQRERDQAGGLSGELAYWKDRLAGYPGILGLPADLPRPARRTARGAYATHRLPAGLAAALRELARREGATLFMVLLAGLVALLHRRTGQDDIVVGVPVAGRTCLATERLIGCFINTLAIRADASGNPDAAGLLGRVRGEVLGALAHQALPFERLVSELDIAHPPNRTPLFQVLFQLRNLPPPGAAWPGLVVTPIPVRTDTAKTDLTLEVVEEPRGLRLECEYDAGLFEPATIERLLVHYEILLHGMARAPATTLDELPLLPRDERDRVLVEWNRTAREYPRERCVHQLLEEQVERTPDAVAVALEGDSLSYRELDSRAARLAEHLRRIGVGPASRVAVSLERTPDLVVALCAALKAGAAYLPIDPTHPAERIGAILADAEPAAVLTRRSLCERLPATPARVVCLDQPRARLRRCSRGATRAMPGATDVAYVMYTSGSTGTPKGVCVPHRAIARLVLNTDYVELGPGDVVAQAASPAFDAATFEIWGALLNGARLEIIPVQTLLSPRRLERALEARGITTLFVTTALFNALARERPGIFGSLKQVLFGGERADPDAVRSVLEDRPPRRLLHVYGPTEATTFATWQLVEELPAETATVPIGRPIANTVVYLLDAGRQPVATGSPGEIYIGGDGLARGYLRHPELTAQRFVPDPFCASDQARLYRTGDLGRQRGDGAIEFIGRIDDQVKVRGFRVEPAEIEAALLSLPGIGQAVVVARPELPADQPLVAYVVPAGDRRIETEALRAHLRVLLPEFMVPSTFVVMDGLPLSPHGKVERSHLPAPTAPACPRRDRDGPPATVLESHLLEIWRRVLGRDDIARRDNFFDLGGHSLLALRLVAELERTLGRRLHIASLFHAPTVEQLAARLAGLPGTPTGRSLVALQPRGSRRPIFFVHGIYGGVFGFLGLARCLAPDQPAYGFQALGLDGDEPRHTTLEEMAAHYVGELRGFQPDGPYSLAGYSLGGLIAFEMACQLRAQGQVVAPLVLLDTHPLSGLPTLVYAHAMLYHIPRRLRFHLARGRELPARRRLGYYRERLRALRRLLVSNRAGPTITRPQPPGAAGQPSRGFASYYQEVAVAYRLGRYPGRVDLFVSDTANPPLMAAWQRHVSGGITRHRIPGPHREILDADHVEGVARLLRGVLDRAQQPAPS